MRKSGFLIVVFFILASCLFAQAQSGLLSKKVTLNIHNLPLRKVLKELEKQGDFHFSYGSKYVPVHTRMNLEVNRESLHIVLDKVFLNMEIRYFEVEGEIVLRPAHPKKVSNPKAESKFTLNGFIKDAGTGESLIGANIRLVDTVLGTVSNPYGFYSLTLPEGTYNLAVSYMGFKTQILLVQLEKDLNLNVNMTEDAEFIEEVKISNTNNRQGSEGPAGVLKIHPATLRKIPAFMGEVDVIKSLEAIPGITFFGDGSTLFYVRGGNKDQNLILLDDAPIFNPAHLFGFFSNIIPDAIKDIKVYKGSMPPGMGGRLSSLVDIRTRDGNMKKLELSGQTGLVASSLSFDGPIKKDHSSFFISGRHSHIKWWLKQFNPNVQSLFFADFNSKFNFIINRKNRLFFTLYYGKDSFMNSGAGGDASGISWNNTSGSIRWNHLFSERLFSNTTFFGGQYDYSLITSAANNDVWNSRISNTGLKTDFTFYPTPGTTLTFGGNVGVHSINPGNFTYGNSARNGSVPLVPLRNAIEWNAYIGIVHRLGERWLLHAGIRNTLWQNSGPATEYVFDKQYQVTDTLKYSSGVVYHSYFRPEPRLGITYAWSKNIKFYLTYDRNVQNIHLITNSVSPFTSLEIWLPSGPNILPQVSDQLALGFSIQLPVSRIYLSIEAYYKKMHHQIDYEYHARMLLNPLVEGELRFGEATSYGLELLLKKEMGKWTGWLGYAYSHTMKNIHGIYQDQPYPAFYDRPHDLSLFVSWQPTSRWTFSSTWIYISGAAFTTPSSFYVYQGHTIPVYTEKNNDRLPDYHRLDLEAVFKLNKPGNNFKHELGFSLYNVYGRKNPVSVNFNKTENSNGDLLVPVNLLVPSELVPGQIWLYKTVPSVNYKFRF